MVLLLVVVVVVVVVAVVVVLLVLPRVTFSMSARLVSSTHTISRSTPT